MKGRSEVSRRIPRHIPPIIDRRNMANTRTKRTSKRRTRKNVGSPLKVAIALRSKRRQMNHRRRRAQQGGSEIGMVKKIMDLINTYDNEGFNFFNNTYYNKNKTVLSDLRSTDHTISNNAFVSSNKFIKDNHERVIYVLNNNYTAGINYFSREELIKYINSLNTDSNK